MTKDTEDFWPEEIGAATEITPVLVLKEQAALLGRRTKNLVEAKVATSITGRHFNHSLSLRVPTLGDYQFRLLSIAHGISIFPVEILDELEPKKTLAKDLDEFTAILKNILSSKKVESTINHLLSYAQN